MADVTSEATLKVDVEGEDELRKLARNFRALEVAAKRVSVQSGRLSTNAAAAVETRAMVNRVSAHGRAAEKAISDAALKRIEAVSYKVGSGVRRGAEQAVVGLGNLVAAFNPLLRVLPASAIGIGTLTAAFLGIGPMILRLSTAFTSLKISFGWAQKAADDALENAAGAFRRFPHLVGKSLDAAAGAAEERMQTIAAIIGDGAKDLQDKITRTWTNTRLEKGIRGDKNIFARWGITPASRKAYEKAQGGKPIDLQQWVEMFVGERERLDEAISKATPGSSEHRRLTEARKRIAEDTLKLFGRETSDVILTTSRKRIKYIQDELKKINEAFELPDKIQGKTPKENALDFKAAMHLMQTTWNEFTEHVGAKVLPEVTKTLNLLRAKFLEVKQPLIDLAESISVSAWQALQEGIKAIDAKTIEEWGASIKKFMGPEGIIKDVKTLIGVAEALGKALAWADKWLVKPVQEQVAKPPELTIEIDPETIAAMQRWWDKSNQLWDVFSQRVQNGINYWTNLDWSAVGAKITAGFDKVGNTILGWPTELKILIAGAWQPIEDWWQGFTKNIRDAFGNVLNSILGWPALLWGKVKETFGIGGGEPKAGGATGAWEVAPGAPARPAPAPEPARPAMPSTGTGRMQLPVERMSFSGDGFDRSFVRQASFDGGASMGSTNIMYALFPNANISGINIAGGGEGFGGGAAGGGFTQASFSPGGGFGAGAGTGGGGAGASYSGGGGAASNGAIVTQGAGSTAGVGAARGRVARGGDPRGMEAYIRATAIKHGIDPDTAVAVAKSEGLSTFQSSVRRSGKGSFRGREDSWGAFQLYMGGGLGNAFQKATGKDPRDPANEQATIDFALAHAKKHGWGSWYGARNTGISNWAGIGGRQGVGAERGRVMQPAGAGEPIIVPPGAGGSWVNEQQQRVAGIRKLALKPEVRAYLEAAGQEHGLLLLLPC